MGDLWVFPCPACGTQPDVHVYSGCDRCECSRYRLNRHYSRWDEETGPVSECYSLGFCQDPISNVRAQVIIERSLQSDTLWTLHEAERRAQVPDREREALVARAVDLARVSEVLTA